MKWQPIETAPKDGSHILGYNADDVYEFSHIKETWFEASLSRWEYIESDSFFKWSPTHWMPLPEPPSET